MDLSPFNLLVKRRWTFSMDSMSCFRQGDQMTEMCCYRSRLVFKCCIWDVDILQGSAATHLRFGGNLVIMLLQIFSWFWQWKNCENRLIFDKVKGFNINCAIFGPPCTVHQTDRPASWVVDWLVACLIVSTLSIHSLHRVQGLGGVDVTEDCCCWWCWHYRRCADAHRHTAGCQRRQNVTWPSQKRPSTKPRPQADCWHH